MLPFGLADASARSSPSTALDPRLDLPGHDRLGRRLHGLHVAAPPRPARHRLDLRLREPGGRDHPRRPLPRRAPDAADPDRRGDRGRVGRGRRPRRSRRRRRSPRKVSASAPAERGAPKRLHAAALSRQGRRRKMGLKGAACPTSSSRTRAATASSSASCTTFLTARGPRRLGRLGGHPAGVGVGAGHLRLDRRGRQPRLRRHRELARVGVLRGWS